MPALINICANIGFGAAVALAGRRSPALREELLSWYLLLLLAFESLCVTPVATFLFRFYPQWSLLYWFDPQLYPDLDQWLGWVSGLVILLNYGAALAGYGATRWGIIHNVSAAQIAPAVVGGVSTLTLLIIFGGRIAYIGDYETYLHGQAEFLLLVPAAWLGLALYIGSGAFVWWLHAHFAKRTVES